MADERARVAGLITASWSTRVIAVACELRLFDALAAGPSTAAQLAAETGSQPQALFRLLRGLASLELVSDLGGESFELTDAGRLLCEGAPGSIRGMALHWGQRLWSAFSQIDQSVKTGKPWRISGLEGFEHMSSDPAQMAMFHQSMADQTAPVARTMLAAYDLSGAHKVMDVGGSYGALLAAVLNAHPSLSGEVFDLEGLAEASTAYLKSQGVADRARFTAGSFFETIPSGADVYMLKSIIHDWHDEDALRIMRQLAAAMSPPAKALLIEQVAPDRVRGGEDIVAIRADLMMLTATGGRERTIGEYRELFEAAGLKLGQVIPTVSAFSVIEALPA